MRLRRRITVQLRPYLLIIASLTTLIYLAGITFVANAHHRRGLILPSRSRWDMQHLAADPGNASAVQEMTRFAWRGYIALCARKQGGNELAAATNSCSPVANHIVGADNLLTVIDSLDTLVLMGLNAEFDEARELTVKTFHPMLKSASVSVFEATIRILGGLLGAFSLTQDPVFAGIAAQVADGLSVAFRDGSFPLRISMQPLQLREEVLAASLGKKTFLAEVGSLYLEFAYMSDITSNEKLFEAVDRYQRVLMKVTDLEGLLPIELVVNSYWKLEGVAGSPFTIGGKGDSFYEYLVKRCLFDVPVESDCIRVFTRALDGIMKHLTVVTNNGLTCIVEMKIGERKSCQMEHLTCFAGGMFALAYMQNTTRTDWLEYAENVTRTCYLSYLHSPTGLGPEIFAFDDKSQRMLALDDLYILRPETVESIYYLYRVTGKQIYRDWGWNIMKALNSSARTASGFSGLKQMTSSPRFDDTQWSFFLAETLKYLYLLFTSSDTLPLDQWVFTTEAHVIPSNRNPLRWEHSSKQRIQKVALLERLLHYTSH